MHTVVGTRLPPDSVPRPRSRLGSGRYGPRHATNGASVSSTATSLPPSIETPRYEVHALRFAHRDAHRQDHFFETVEDPMGPMSVNYYIWLARSANDIVVIDAGYTPETSARRARTDGRTYLQSPLETLQQLGVELADVGTLSLSHLHYDHTGFLGSFTDARIVLQERELAFWCGRDARRPHFANLCARDDVAELVRRNLAGAVRLVDGDAEIAPGISVHRVGGHTPGIQVVRVPTEDGWVVVASDASHFTANFEQRRPYAIVHTLPLMYDAFDRLDELATHPEFVIPGHDPTVMERFGPSSPDLEGLAVRIA